MFPLVVEHCVFCVLLLTPSLLHLHESPLHWGLNRFGAGTAHSRVLVSIQQVEKELIRRKRNTRARLWSSLKLFPIRLKGCANIYRTEQLCLLCAYEELCEVRAERTLTHRHSYTHKLHTGTAYTSEELHCMSINLRGFLSTFQFIGGQLLNYEAYILDGIA